MFVKLSPYLIAMAIGLMIGIERERRHLGRHAPMGVRSFLLLGLFGAIAGGLGEPLIALGFAVFAGCAALVGYLRATTNVGQGAMPLGLTTEIAAMITFGLGYFSSHEPLLSLVLGGIMLSVLLNKTILHNFTKQRLKANELQAGATLLLLAFGVIPLIPDRTIDPFGIFNPNRLAVLIALIGGIQFCGYAASRIFGSRIGLPLSGFLAGNISSTAAFVTFPRLAETRPASYLSISSAATFAIMATLIQLLVLVFAVTHELAVALFVPLGSIIVICGLLGFFLSYRCKKSSGVDHKENPLSLWAAVKVGILLTSLIFVVELAQKYLGTIFAKALTFVAALFELHGVAIASANMFENQTVSIDTAARTIMIAVSASMVSKLVLTFTLSKGKYRTIMLVIVSGLTLACIFFYAMINVFPDLVLKIL